MDELDKACGLTITKEQGEVYEKMDRLYVATFHYANKRCRKLKAGEVAFAPETLQLEARKANLWVLCLRKARGCRVSSKLIKRIAKSVKIEDPMSVTLGDMEMRRNEAFKQYRTMKPNSREIRDAWLEKKSIGKYGTNNTELGDILTRMRKVEERRDAHRKIKFARKKLTSEGTKKLIVPERNGQGHIEVTEKEEIKTLLMNTNKEKFQQANSTPLAIEPLRSLLGPRALTKTAEEILTGIGIGRIDEMIHPVAQDFLKHVKMDDIVMTGGAIDC